MPATRDIWVRFAPGCHRSPATEFGYGVAGRRIWSNRPIGELTPFAIAGQPERGWPPADRPRWIRDLVPVYEGRGWVAGREVDVECAAAGNAYQLRIDAVVRIDLELRRDCLVMDVEGEASEPGARFAVLGPGLALALAADGVFSLHASAVAIGDRLVVLVGDSGAGKSTLAARVATSPAGRVADDVVPIRAPEGGGLFALPRFPQLKLTSREQFSGRQEISVDEILRLRRDPACARPVRRPLSVRDEVRQMLENTVAARLFAADLRARHLDGCIRAAAAVPVSELQIPEGLERLDEVRDLLASDPRL